VSIGCAHRIGKLPRINPRRKELRRVRDRGGEAVGGMGRIAGCRRRAPPWDRLSDPPCADSRPIVGDVVRDAPSLIVPQKLGRRASQAPACSRTRSLPRRAEFQQKEHRGAGRRVRGAHVGVHTASPAPGADRDRICASTLDNDIDVGMPRRADAAAVWLGGGSRAPKRRMKASRSVVAELWRAAGSSNGRHRPLDRAKYGVHSNY